MNWDEKHKSGFYTYFSYKREFLLECEVGIMFKLFKRKKQKPECQHEFYIEEKIYRDRRSLYTNHPDVVDTYLITVCKKCGKRRASEEHIKQFPLWWADGKRQKSRYLGKIRSHGFIDEEDYVLNKLGKKHTF